jgi:DNA polymerase-3 subunit alpha
MEYGGLEKEKIDDLWHMIEPFAAYGFNKAHAASYGMVAYKTAYLKANYAPEYLSACMTAESGDIETCGEYINEAKRMGFTILPPDVNESYSDFTVVVEDGILTKKIRFGLRNVKNFGEEIGKAIIAERKANGPFKTIEDFLERVQHKNLNKKSLEALIMCGAMDKFGDRSLLYKNSDALLAFHKGLSAFIKQNQNSLFEGLIDKPQNTLQLPNQEIVPINTRLEWERELLGLYISGHPLDQYLEQIKKTGNTIKKLMNPEGGFRKDWSKKLLVAYVASVKVILTKSGGKMAFLALQDKSGTAEGVVFTENFKKFGDQIIDGTVVVMNCSVADRGDRKSILVDDIKVLK